MLASEVNADVCKLHKPLVSETLKKFCVSCFLHFVSSLINQNEWSWASSVHYTRNVEQKTSYIHWKACRLDRLAWDFCNDKISRSWRMLPNENQTFAARLPTLVSGFLLSASNQPENDAKKLNIAFNQIDVVCLKFGAKLPGLSPANIVSLPFWKWTPSQQEKTSWCK